LKSFEREGRKISLKVFFHFKFLKNGSVSIGQVPKVNIAFGCDLRSSQLDMKPQLSAIKIKIQFSKQN